jgi:hypothetical protein
MKTVKQLLSQVKKDYMGIPRMKNSWTKSYKEATKHIRFVNGITFHYANRLGFTQQEVLQALEDKRTYWSANYYQSANFPRISKRVAVYETMDDFHKDCPSSKYMCPACNSVSTNSSVCDSGVVIKGKKCDWKAYGLFGTIGKGYRFLIKKEFLTEPHIYNIFMPVEKT